MGLDGGPEPADAAPVWSDFLSVFGAVDPLFAIIHFRQRS